MGSYDLIRYVFYSSRPNLTRDDFKNTIKTTISKLQQKYKRKNPFDLLRTRAFHNEFKLELKRKGFIPIENYNYVDFNEILQ